MNVFGPLVHETIIQNETNRPRSGLRTRYGRQALGIGLCTLVVHRHSLSHPYITDMEGPPMTEQTDWPITDQTPTGVVHEPPDPEVERRRRESYALWMFDDTYWEHWWIMEKAWRDAQVNVAKENPEWVKQNPQLFKPSTTRMSSWPYIEFDL